MENYARKTQHVIKTNVIFIPRKKLS